MHVALHVSSCYQQPNLPPALLIHHQSCCSPPTVNALNSSIAKLLAYRHYQSPKHPPPPDNANEGKSFQHIKTNASAYAKGRFSERFQGL